MGKFGQSAIKLCLSQNLIEGVLISYYPTHVNKTIAF